MDLVLKYPMLNLHATHYLPQTTQLVLPETNHQTQIRENTNHQLNPMAAEYNHPEPHPHTTSQNQQEKTNLEEPSWEGVDSEDNTELNWEETELEDTFPSSPNKTEENRCVSQKNSNSRMNASRILTQNVRGLPEEDDTKLKSIINQMKNENWDAACLQETWILGTDDLYIDNYHIFFQGNSTKINTRG
jgi:hypothetical protein